MDQQIFNGKIYKRYDGRDYFTQHKYLLHRVVWEFHNGKIPDGMQIHHIDGDTSNNDISNLECLTPKEHTNRHSGKDYSNFQKAGVEASKDWHKSEEGKKFHSEIGKKSWIDKPKYTKVCEVCANQYQTYFPERSKFCNKNCKAKSLRRRRKLSTI